MTILNDIRIENTTNVQTNTYEFPLMLRYF